MTDDTANQILSARALSWRTQVIILVVFVLAIAGGVLGMHWLRSSGKSAEKAAPEEQVKRSPDAFYPTKEQWATITAEPVEQRSFRPARSTDGKIAVNEDRNTPIFSPYSGRIVRILAQPGDQVQRGQPLFTVEATDNVQAQNDFLTARAALNKAKAQLAQAQTTERRQHDLYKAQAAALKDWEQAKTDLAAAQSDLRSAEVSLEAARNRLRILGKSDREIAEFETKGAISPDTPIYSPIAGTVIQRKIGPGQYVSSGASDPAFIIGDLSRIWLVANVRESDASLMKLGRPVEVTVLAYPDRKFSATIAYVASMVDPATRRLQVRAEIDNSEGLLKPEMFASFSIATGDAQSSPAVPRNAIVYEGDTARVWVARDDGGIELRQIKPGLADGDKVEVVEGVKAGEKVVTKGSLFIDRAASGEQS